MNIHIRRAVAFLLIITFFIVAPILLLYTAGYRYNIKKQEVQKTGSLVLNSKPTGATITLNNKPISEKTAIRLNNIVPDDYLINIAKDGYYPWEKKLSVKAQETTFAENIILFKKSEPEKISNQQIEKIIFSPNNKNACYWVKNNNKYNLYLLNLSNQKEKLLSENIDSFDNTNISWAPDDSKFILNTGNKYFINFAVLPYQTVDITNIIIKNKLKNIRWDIDTSNVLYAQDNNTVYVIDILSLSINKKYTLNAGTNLIDYIVFQNEVFTIENTNTDFNLTKHSLNPELKNTLYNNIELNGDNYSISSIQNYKLIFADNKNPTLFFSDLDLGSILYQKSNVLTIRPEYKQNLLLLTTNQELSYLNLSSSPLQEKNITRYSQGLGEAYWHKSVNYVFALQNNKIDIIELDDRDRHLVTTLPIDNVTSFSLNADGNTIFFVKDKNLYSLQIMD